MMLAHEIFDPETNIRTGEQRGPGDEPEEDQIHKPHVTTQILPNLVEWHHARSTHTAE